MKGYLNNKAATDAVIDKDGYFHTGDIATVDRDGNYYLYYKQFFFPFTSY
jgi:long-chain acyl-CoA synthetase